MAFDSIETPFGKAEKVIGGACTYISWAASYFTDNIKLVSIVGGDFPADELRQMEQRGVNLEGLKIVSDKKSFYWSGKYHDNMISRDTLVTELNVLADFDPVLPESYRHSEYIMLGNLTPAIQISVLDQLRSKPKLVVLDTMNFWMDVAMDDLKKVLTRVDVLTINDEEARQLSGEYSLVKAAEIIQNMGPRYLIVKKGEHGALLFHKSQIFFAPALPLAFVEDPTGAGDTFAGGFIGYLAKTDDTGFENIKRAIIMGSVMASYCVEAFSLDKLKSLSQNDISERTDAFRKMVHFDIP